MLLEIEWKLQNRGQNVHLHTNECALMPFCLQMQNFSFSESQKIISTTRLTEKHVPARSHDPCVKPWTSPNIWFLSECLIFAFSETHYTRQLTNTHFKKSSEKDLAQIHSIEHASHPARNTAYKTPDADPTNYSQHSQLN